VKEEYVRHMQAFKEKFKRRCREYNIDFVEVDINTSYDKVLKDYLIKRRTLYK
jgi:hypothetical protein